MTSIDRTLAQQLRQGGKDPRLAPDFKLNEARLSNIAARFEDTALPIDRKIRVAPR